MSSSRMSSNARHNRRFVMIDQELFYPATATTPEPPEDEVYERRLRQLRGRAQLTSLKMAPVSPSSSPRLPSPPPFTEVQIGPQSPGINATQNPPATEADELERLEQGAMRRIRPGTKAADMASGPPLRPLTEVDSAFQFQEHLKALYYEYTRSPDLDNTTTQLTHETALAIATPPPGADRSLWLYELCRFLVLKANSLVVQFFADSPPCSAATCPEMRASEWQYLCAVHEPPKPCCAIDYCCHTLDWAATTLASQKHFPSRLTLGNEASGGSQAGVRQLTNIMRRVYRIFAHAWFQHRQVFWQVESHEGLYMLFKTVCDIYSLIPEENYTIPPEAEGLAAKEEDEREGKAVMKKQHGGEEATSSEDEATTTISTGATTRRHKATHSFSSSVTAIAEGDEDDSKADSPVKDKAGGPLDTISSSMMKEAPLAQISKTAEKKEEEEPASSTKKTNELPIPEIVEPAAEKQEISNEAEKDEEGGEGIADTPAVEGEESTSEPNTTAGAELEGEKEA